MLELKLLLLLVVANATPVLLRLVFKGAGDNPVDFRLKLADGYRLLGDSKTWRGLLGAPLATMTVGMILGIPAVIAFVAGLLAMSGDLISSFIKRRMGLVSSAKMRLLDQLPESLLPLIYLNATLGIGWFAVLWLCVAFVLLNVYLSPLLFRLGIRKRPY